MGTIFYPKMLPQDNIDWIRHVSLIGRSNAALARYDGILRGIVNPEVLLSPLITEEAIISSRIEGMVTTLEEILASEGYLKIDLSESKKADIQEVNNYREAIQMATSELEIRHLYIPVIKSLHKKLLDGVRGKNKEPGEVRSWQNWIGPPGCSIEEATYVPPPPVLVWEYLNNWEEYLDSEEKDPIVQIAILKGQFELIHPFSDGNGRVGRMLIPLIMYNKNLISSPMFYISGFFDQNREEYYHRLLALSKDNDWDGWIDFFLRGVEHQANENAGKANKIIALYAVMKNAVPEILKSKYSVQVIDALFTRPIFTINDFVRDSGIPYDSGQKIIMSLKKNSVISVRKERRGQNPSVYEFSDLLAII
ncbi:Fic family protein [Methanogenium sp. MK-MG]|uniref:Fic family protein n=1 Tax=Methanogenium sp. MK-MG TaxID=2599926 RepID=UPI0013EBEE4F|nr:Fic/DOC family N-terminal domain-containing protein [Methanogenium sp. MK-MG]KAF1073552.1 hypothetical protein MKMG_02132 [Methanogenium sp. MK-MG]